MIKSANTINELVMNIYSDSCYKRSLSNMLYKQNRKVYTDDLFEDLLITILEHKRPDELVGIYNKGDFFNWWLRLCANNVKSKTSRFYYKYINVPFCVVSEKENRIEEYTKDIHQTIDDNTRIQAIEQFLEEAKLISRKHFIAVELFKLKHFDGLSIRQISENYKMPSNNRLKKLTISERSIFLYLKFMDEYINENFSKDKYI